MVTLGRKISVARRAGFWSGLAKIAGRVLAANKLTAEAAA